MVSILGCLNGITGMVCYLPKGDASVRVFDTRNTDKTLDGYLK